MSQHVDKLVMMANQIAHAFRAQGAARAVPQIAEHIRLFWTPEMRHSLAEHAAKGGEGLEEMAREAISSLHQAA